MKHLLCVIAALVSLSCAPQAAYFQVDVRDMNGTELDVAQKQVAVFSLVPEAVSDSVRTANAALALAQKLEHDRGLENPLSVFSIPLLDFAGFGEDGYDKEYLHNLMLSTGADLQIFVTSLKFGQYRVEDSELYGEYGERIVMLPYSVKMEVYDAIEDTVVMRHPQRDTIYLSLLSQNGRKNFGSVVAAQLPQVCKVIGESLGSTLSRQWNRQERMLVNYQGDEKWEKPLAKALDFKWKEAIELWMPLADDLNSHKASYAAYNIAVACDMLGNTNLALEWAEFSVKKYRFMENSQFQNYLESLKDI